MPTITRIATIQRSLRELGRIRLGDQVEFQKDGRTLHRPRKLATFRLTSASREYIAAAAAAYGGDVHEWESPRGREYEVTITSPTLDVLVPPGDAVSQAFELWTDGGCQRRCNGITQDTGEACACPSDANERTALAAKGQACKPTTRLWVILPRLPDLGRWRLESHGYYAAVELAGMAEIASMATARGIMLPARLRIDQRRRKIPGQPTREYIVPVLELHETTFGQLVTAGFIPTTAAELPSGEAVPQLATGVPATPQLAPGKPARAKRPPMGEAPSLPAEADFGRPTMAAFGSAPETPVGGWPVEEDENGSSSVSPGETGGDNPTVAPSPELTKGQFNQMAVEARLTKATIGEAHDALGLPPTEGMAGADWWRLARELGLVGDVT